MAISGIQPGIGLQEDIFSPYRRKNAPAPTEADRNRGPDTVTFSEEALLLAGRSGEEQTQSDEASVWERESDRSADAEQDKLSLKGKGVNLLGMLMDSLFLASLEESEEASRAVAEGEPGKQPSPLADTGKAAELGNVLKDVATGKKSLADLPQAMAAAASDKPGPASSPAAKKQDNPDKA